MTLKLFYDFFFYPTDRPNLSSGGRWETKHFIGMTLSKTFKAIKIKDEPRPKFTNFI